MKPQNPYESPRQTTPPPVAAPPSVNRIGLAGLVVGLVAWGIVAVAILTAVLGFAVFFPLPTGVIVLLLGVIGLVLSIIGLFKQPRGAAVLGLMLSCALGFIVCGGAFITVRSPVPQPVPGKLQAPSTTVSVVYPLWLRS